MCTRSRFGWEEMFDGFVIDVEFENPVITFRKEAERGDFDTLTDDYYSLLLDHVELLGSFFDDRPNVFGCTFFSNVVFYLLEHDVDVDNIALILRRMVNVLFTCSNGVFLLDGVLTTLYADKEEAVGSSLSWRPVVRDSGECRVGNIPLFKTSKCIDLSNFIRFVAVRFYMQHNEEIPLSEIVDDITAFVREKFFVFLFSRLCLSAYVDKDWDTFEKQVDEENQRKGLYDFDNRCELEKNKDSSVSSLDDELMLPLDFDIDQSDIDQSDIDQSDIDQSDIDQSDIDQSDIDQSDILDVKLAGCYFVNQQGKEKSHICVNDKISFHPDKWCPDDVDWLNNGYINGVSVLDILKSGTVGPKGLMSSDDSFAIDDPQAFHRNWGRGYLCLRIYGNVTVEYRYPKQESSNIEQQKRSVESEPVVQSAVLNVMLAGCYLVNKDRDGEKKDCIRTGDKVDFRPNKWRLGGVDWLNNGYINGISVLDILESGTIDSEGLASTDGSFVIVDDDYGCVSYRHSHTLTLKIYKDVTIEYRYPESEVADKFDVDLDEFDD